MNDISSENQNNNISLHENTTNTDIDNDKDLSYVEKQQLKKEKLNKKIEEEWEKNENAPKSLNAKYSKQIEDQKKLADDNIEKQKQAVDVNTTIDNIDKITADFINSTNEGLDNKTLKPIQLIRILNNVLTPVLDNINTVISSNKNTSIPGLADITTLLSKLYSFQTSLSSSNDTKLPDLPSDLNDRLNDLLQSTIQICTALPIALINVAFKIINQILEVKIPIPVHIASTQRIKDMSPCINPPASLIDTCIQVGENSQLLVQKMPSTLVGAVKNTMKINVKNLGDLQVPITPNNISVSVPESLPKVISTVSQNP